MVRHGLRPNVDFGHMYGLLGLLFSDAWFRIAGLTPAAYWAGVFLFELAMCAATTEFAIAADLSSLSIVFLFASFPIFLWVNYFNFAHVIEAFCLMLAVIAHLKGRYDFALAAAAMAVLARPALGYVYGFVLLCVVLMKVFHTHSLRLSVLVLPICSTVFLAIVLAWRFGFASLIRTLLPITGAAAYRAVGYGFFNRGMAFWWPNPFSLRFYLGVPGFWLLVNASLLLLGPIAVLRARHTAAESLERHKSEVLGATAVVIFFWIFFVFSHQYIGSWILYLWLAVWATTLLPHFFHKYAAVIVLLILIAVNADRHLLLGPYPQWSSTKISSLFPHTFSQGNEDQQIKELFSAVRGRKVLVLIHSGAMPLMQDGLGEPLTEFYVPGGVMPGEKARIKSAANAAEMIVIPTPPWYSSDIEYFSWPEFLDRPNSYRMVFRNPSGFVLTRSTLD